MDIKKRTVSSLQDLADIAGVSRATVSRALNDSPLLNEETKKSLRKLAEKHNYTVNRRARNFRLRRTSVISVVFMLDVKSDQHMSDPFFLDMLGVIADNLAEHDYDLLLAHAPITDVAALMDGRVFNQSDGVIFIGQGEQHQDLNLLATHRQRMVVWGYPMPDKNYVVVGSKNLEGGYIATRHLLDLGRRKIAFFGRTSNPENAARYQGYLNAHTDSGISPDPSLRFDMPFEIQGARDEIVKIVDSKAYFDAVFCVTDVTAMASISKFQEMGIDVPDEVAVVGYDDISLAEFCNPPLTTVKQNIRKAGKVLVDSIRSLVDGQPVEDTILDAELVIRKSSGADPND